MDEVVDKEDYGCTRTNEHARLGDSKNGWRNTVKGAVWFTVLLVGPSRALAEQAARGETSANSDFWAHRFWLSMTRPCLTCEACFRLYITGWGFHLDIG